LHQDTSTGIGSGFRLLDRELPTGGWPRSSLTELLVRDLGIGELRFLAPTLRMLTRSNQNVVLLTPPHIPYAPAFEAMGIDHSKVLVVNAERPIDRLWAVEQSIKSKQFGALVTWLDSPRHQVRPDHIRRLQLAASSTQGLVFAFRPFEAQHQSSPAPLRMLLLPRRYPDLAVQIIKRRGPVMSAPIDLAIPIPGKGLRPLTDEQAISIQQSPIKPPLAQHHALDRMRDSAALPAALLASTSAQRSSARD
jgi:cell division inhibitor SulA